MNEENNLLVASKYQMAESKEGVRAEFNQF